MAKQVQLSNALINRLEAIRAKYENCSYTRAIDYLINEENNPNQYISKRITEIKTMIWMNYPEDSEVRDAFDVFLTKKAKLLQAMTAHDRKYIKHLDGDLEEF